MKMVDPPGGWNWGFPKEFDFEPSHHNLPGEEYQRELRQWFLDNGVPSKELNLTMEYSRYWETE